ncbi:hypothetical protein BU26DRAFT_515209 [Trematosphaeria pertusa]|uniref:Uncharacterized protein n=1 Tax=Trematosphaeria pertusa TaxID=390896 RepID=A0A6A6IR12_9PLEO|nr:uncharacterized protein BU26DRAFT_515209 [Trematosphaeria pertusa]KAF2252749.1 hypothetical protein BU26DRAFT_515209 [Trematosphaeria pertusa]
MTSETSNALNAIGTLIGYIGTEVATDDFFDRLLWPRRSYNGFSWGHIPKVALLMPMGGPLHKAALSTLDDFYKHGLYERHQQGHMLGTSFFRDTKLRYRVYGDEAGYENEYVRNGLWVRAIIKMPFPVSTRKQGGEECGEISKVVPKVRQKICVGHLELMELPVKEKVSMTSTVFDDAGRPTLRTYLALLTTELSAIVVSITVAVAWRSAFACLWLLPLALKFISALLALNREKLKVPSPLPAASPPSAKPVPQGKPSLFGVRNPAGGFVLVDADESIALQFFRHHGHPARSKNREIIQIAIVVAFTLVFPIGLICSTLWMGDALQKMWVGYQLYATLAMYVYRYSGGHLWCTTEEQIGEAFARSENGNQEGSSLVMFKADDGSAIAAKLERTCHSRYGEAVEYVENFIQKWQQRNFPASFPPETGVCSGKESRSSSSGSDFIERRRTDDWS